MSLLFVKTNDRNVFLLNSTNSHLDNISDDHIFLKKKNYINKD